MDGERFITFTISGPPEIARKFFDDYQSLVRKNKMPLSKILFIEFFGLFLDNLYLASIKPEKIATFQATIKQ